MKRFKKNNKKPPKEIQTNNFKCSNSILKEKKLEIKANQMIKKKELNINTGSTHTPKLNTPIGENYE